jgi:hypothetical protein
LSRCRDAAKMQAMQRRLHTPVLFSQVVRTVARWWPHPAVDEQEAVEWADTDRSWHNSSFDLARGMEVIEHFDAPMLVFADTLPACHFPMCRKR